MAKTTRGDPVWAVVLGSVLLLLVVSAGVTGAIYFAKRTFIDRTSPEAVDAAFAADPYAAPLLAEVRDNFPADYAKIREGLSQSARAGAKPAALQAESFALLRQAALAHLNDLAQAPHAELAAFNAAETRVVEEMEMQDLALCGRYIMRGFGPGDVIAPSIKARVSEMGVAQWRGAAAGRDHPAKRALSPTLSPRDSAALVAAMRKQGMDDRDLQVFVTPVLMARAAPAQQCSLGKWLLAAVGKLPPEQSDRISAWLILQKRN